MASADVACCAAAGALLRVCRAGEVALVVAGIDDGVGFDVAAGSNGVGLVNMRDRIAAAGGELSIESSPGRGTRVSGSVPDGQMS